MEKCLICETEFVECKRGQVTSVTDAVIEIQSALRRSEKMQKLFNIYWRKSLQQIIARNIVFLRTLEFHRVLPRRRNLFATQQIK